MTLNELAYANLTKSADALLNFGPDDYLDGNIGIVEVKQRKSVLIKVRPY